jgi:replication initiator protein
MTDDRDDSFSILTPVSRRRIESSAEMLEAPAERIVYQHTVLCQTALPYRDPGDEVREWERHQGAVALKIHAGEALNPATRRFVKLGLPYGSRPRLILTHLNSEALKTSSPRIDVERSLTAFIRRIQDRPPTGPEVRRFKEQLARLAAAGVRMAVGISSDRAFQVDTKIIDAFELWLAKGDSQRVLWPSVVELSPRYFDSLARHAVPLDERAIAALSNSSLALDVYAWLAQRLHRIPNGKPQRLTWKALYDQFGFGYQHIRQFRAGFLKLLTLVKTQYPAARVAADEAGLELRQSSPPISARPVPVGNLTG